MKKLIRIYSFLIIAVLCGCASVGRVETGRPRYETPPIIVPTSVARPSIPAGHCGTVMPTPGR